jgi:hypothetical protein
MDILLKKIELCLSKYSNNDLNELHNRLSNDTLIFMFNSFLKITNNDYTYIVEDLNNKFNIDIKNKQNELDKTKNDLDILNKTFNNYKENNELTIQSKSNELCNIKTNHLNERIIDIETYYKNQIINLQNNHNEHIKLYEQQINNINKTNISNETLDSFKEDLIDIINTTPDINNETANIKGQFGENIINNIKEEYKLCQEFHLEDTTNIESNGDFIAHNIYPNITDKILIESKFVKTICTTKNIKHGKSDLVRFEEHSSKFFKENPNSHSIIFSMNSDKIPSKGFYHIENIDNHYMFYVSVNYSKINNLEIFQNIINFIFHTIVMYIVENNKNNNKYDINDNTNILIKLLEKSYHKENNTINILENTISRLQKDILEYNQLVSDHKNNITEIVTTFTKINHNFETTNKIKPIINMSIVHKYMQTNNYNLSYFNDISCKELKLVFPELPNKFTKKKLIEDYNTYLNSL